MYKLPVFRSFFAQKGVFSIIKTGENHQWEKGVTNRNFCGVRSEIYIFDSWFTGFKVKGEKNIRNESNC